MKLRLILSYFFAIIFFLFILSSQKLVRISLLGGMKLWAFHLVPTLFPVILFAKYTLKAHLFEHIIASLSKTKLPSFLHQIFCTLPILLLAIFCGIPTGSIYFSSLVEKKRIPPSVASALLALSSLCSLSFLLGYGRTMYPGPIEAWNRLLFCLYVPLPFFYLFIFRKSAGKCNSLPTIPIENVYQKRNPPITGCIMDTIQTLLLIGGNILFCSMLLAILHPWLRHNFIGTILLAQIEITTGLQLLSSQIVSPSTPFDLAYLSTLCFGGICAMNQVFTIARNPYFSRKNYLYWKFCHLIASCGVYLILLLFSRSLLCF